MKKSISTMLVCLSASAIPLSAVADGCKVDCGQVVSVNEETREGKGSGLGAVAGGVAGGLIGSQIGGGRGKTIATVGGIAGGAYAGHQVEKHMKSRKVYVLTVKMDDGQTRNFESAQKPQMIAGDRVQVVKGKPERYAGK